MYFEPAAPPVFDCKYFKSQITCKWYVLPIIRHRCPIAITEDDPTRHQLPKGVLFCSESSQL